MVVMYLLLLVGLLKSNGFDTVEEWENSKIVSLHNDYILNTNRSGGTLLLIPPHRLAFSTSDLSPRGNLYILSQQSTK